MIRCEALKRFNKAFKLLSDTDKLRCKVDEIFHGKFSIDIKEDSQGKIVSAKHVKVSNIEAEPKDTSND